MKESIFRLVQVLTVICVVSAGALAFVYEATREPIAEQIRQEKLRAIQAVLPEYDNQPDTDVMEAGGRTFYVGRKAGKWVAVAFQVAAKGFGGDIGLMLGVDREGKVTGVRVLTHKETPGLGAKIEQAWFLEQFAGRGLGRDLALKRDGGEIDQITGATISSRAVLEAVKAGLEEYQA